MLTDHRHERGVSLIEVMVTLLIMILLASLAAPSFNGYLSNLAIRGTAEGMLSALQSARGEAVRSNNTTVLQIVDSLDNGCGLDGNGRFWVVSHCSAVGACGQDIDRQTPPPAGGCAAPIILAKGSFDGDERVSVNMTAPSVCYSGFGRINPAANNCPGGTLAPDAASGGVVSFDIKHSSGECLTNGGELRCLRINIGMGGQPRLCDPSVTASNDPRRC